MKYLSADELLLIHSSIVDETGGLHGVRDLNRIQGIEVSPQQKVFGKELYPTIFLKAAVYIREIITTHPFIDGNKRTGITTGVIFLEDNGFVFSAEKGEIEKFALKIIQSRLELEDIATWLKKHCKKIKRKKK